LVYRMANLRVVVDFFRKIKKFLVLGRILQEGRII
jgi:hypothetical protein